MEPVYEKCPMCLGTKEILGIGMIRRKCEHCKELGFVPVQQKEQIIPKIDPVDYQHTPTQVDDIIDTLSSKPRRGRPPKEAV
jgi:hypothetical protein